MKILLKFKNEKKKNKNASKDNHNDLGKIKLDGSRACGDHQSHQVEIIKRL